MTLNGIQREPHGIQEILKSFVESPIKLACLLSVLNQTETSNQQNFGPPYFGQALYIYAKAFC